MKLIRIVVFLLVWMPSKLMATYGPIALSGFNADVVADIAGNANGSTSASYDQSNYVFMAPSYNPSGTALPVGGVFTTAITSTPGLTFQLAPYTVNNSLRLTANQTGSLNFVTPSQAQEIFVLGSTGQGFSVANIVVTFTDATTQSFTNVTIQDWFNGSDFAIKGMGRCLRTTNAITNDTSNPRIYQVKLDLLPANHYKNIQSIAFTNTVTTSAVMNIMAISTNTPPPLFPHDPGVSFISKPAGFCFSATQILAVRIKNYGLNQINLVTNPVSVTLNVNGPSGLQTQTKMVSTGVLNAYAVDSITVLFNGANTFNLSMGGNYYINSSITIGNFGGVVNGNLQNDSINPGHTLVNYRPLPGPDYQLCQGSSIPFGQGLTVSGCSTPLFDSATITFTLGSGCTDNVGSTGTGASTGLPANCADQYACSFGSGILPALQNGAFFTTSSVLTITNLALNPAISSFYSNANSVYMNLYGSSPTFPNLFSPGAQGANGTLPFTYTRSIPAADMTAMYSTLTPGNTVNLGYWETFNDNAALSDIITNNGGTSVATLKIYYYYYLPSFEWYDVATGGSSLYSLSPFNPLSVNNTVVNNSNTPGTYTFYVACAGTSTCRTPVNLNINPTPAVFQDTITQCEDIIGSNSSVVDFTSIDNMVNGGNTNTQVNYFYDQSLQFGLNNPTAELTSSTTVYSKVSFPITGCYSSDSVVVIINSKPQIQPDPMNGLTCNCIDVVSLINPFSTIPIGSDTLFYEDALCTITHPNPHNICTEDTVYVVVKTNSIPFCSDTVAAYIDISSGTNFLVNQNTFNSSDCTPNFPLPTISNTLVDGVQNTFFNPIDCKKLATVTDVSNGISLGTTSVEVEIDCNTPIYNDQPYIIRHYKITPSVQDSAQVCIYFLEEDILDFNSTSANLGWPILSPGLTNLNISKVSNGGLNDPNHTFSLIPNNALTINYDALSTIWTVCFMVDSFSYFYGHSANPVNAALPVLYKTFIGKSTELGHELTWITSQERNNDYFILERSRDGKNFAPLSEKIYSQGQSGHSDLELKYQFNDGSPLWGNNYYRLQQFDKDGKASYSKVIHLFNGQGDQFNFYPNPVSQVLHGNITVQKSTSASITIEDPTGRKLLVLDIDLQVGANRIELPTQNLPAGMYVVRVNKGTHTLYTQTLLKR